MREIDYSSQFERDYKRESKSSDLPLPRKHQDHALKGEYVGTRECHVKPDLLLIYFKMDKTLLTLVRLGSHSELF